MKRLRIWSWLAFTLTSVVQGELLPGIDPGLPETQSVESLPPLKAAAEGAAGTGGVLCPQLAEIQLESWTGGPVVQAAAGLSSEQDLILPSPVTLAAKLSKWRGHALTEGDLVAIVDTILIHYDVEGYPVVGIDVPRQDFQAGKLRLVVEIGRIGKLGVTRPKYGKPTALTRGLKLRRGELLRREELDEQLAWYGRTIFRKPKLLVSPGAEPATADLLIALAEQKPWRVSLGYENSGPVLLGRDRFLLGVAGMTPDEHVLAWQTVVGEPLSSLQAHALGWEIPFHRIHQTLQLDAAWAKVLTYSVSSGLPVENTGTSWSVAAMQRMALPQLGKWRQDLRAGFECKATDQFVLFGGLPFSPGEVRLLNAKTAYGLGREWKDGAFSLEASMIASPGGLIPGNDDADFHVYDPQADSTYLIGRLSAGGWWSPGGDWRIALRGMAQLTDCRLLPVEQFAAGGYQTVRGVPEREYYADNGWQSSVEIHSPAVTLRNLYQARLLAFYDQAMLDNRGERGSAVSGAGIGLRVRISDFFDLRADQGWRLDDDGRETHIGLQFAY